MDEQKAKDGGQAESSPLQDMVEEKASYNQGAEETGDRGLEVHKHARRHVPGQHIDLLQDEYTPEEIAHLLGTSVQVVMHAIWNDELKAERKGQDVVSVAHADLTDWLGRRDP